MNKSFTRRQVVASTSVLIAIGLVPAPVAAGLVTPRQVEGPFYPVDVAPDRDLDLTRVERRMQPAKGEAILVQGRILDVKGNPIKGAIVDVWQANTHGRYIHVRDRNPAPLDPNFVGFGRIETNDDGVYFFRTIKPGAYPLTRFSKQRWRSRHIHFKISSANFKHLTTQMYFSGDPMLETDREFAKLPKELRPLVVANQQGTMDGVSMFNFDIVLENT